MACRTTLNLSGACELETCTTADRVSSFPRTLFFLTGQSALAYASDLCYCLVITRSGGTDYFNKYDPATNTLIEKVSTGYQVTSKPVYDALHKKFVTAAGTRVLIFDPMTETLTSFENAGILGGFTAFVYVPLRQKVYGGIGENGLGEHYVGYVDLDLSTVVQLGVVPSFGGSQPFTQSGMAYSPVTDCLYGPWTTGLSSGLFEFDLGTNTCVHKFTMNPNGSGYSVQWDPVRMLIITFAAVVQEYEVVTETIVRETWVPASLESVRFTPFYVASMKKMFASGFDALGQRVICSYLCESPYTIALVKSDYDYRAVENFKDGSFIAQARGLPGTTPDGVRRLCLP